MVKKADNVREALLNGASPHRIALVTIQRAQAEHPKMWRLAAITQLSHILKLSLRSSVALVSEMSVEQIHGITRPNPNT